MTAIHSHAFDSQCSLTAALQDYADAGIDPAFDEEMAELERQFAELRMTFANH